MIKSNIYASKITRNRERFPLFLFITMVIVILSGGIGVLIPSLMSKASPILDQIGASVGTSGYGFWGLLISALIMAFIIILRQNELAVSIVIASSIITDLYLGLYAVSLLIAVILLLAFFLTRSPRYLWVKPPALWLWVLFLALAIFPATQGIIFFDSTQYYLRVFLSAFIIFWLGTLLARDTASIRRLLRILYFFGTLVAIITFIQVTTGKLLFSTPRNAALLQSVSGYQLSGASISRAGAFLINPDPNAGFLAMMLMIGLGLLIESPSLLSKVLFFAGSLLTATALLFTFSTEGIVGALAGCIVLIAFLGHRRYRVILLLLIVGAATLIFVSFPAQLNLLLQHAETPSELQLRIGAWQTGLRVIQAFPLTGIGLGNYVYRLRAEPYRVPAQYGILDHPHNSYLEWAALGGIPILIIFITLLSFALLLALHNWLLADVRGRPLLGTGIAVVTVLCFFSLSDAGWTFTPLAALGWLMLGVISSPLLRAREKSDNVQKDSIDKKKNSL